MSGNRLWALQYRLAPYLFVLPFVAIFAVFMLYPLLHSVGLSLHQTAGPRHQVFVGLANYRFLLRDRLFGWAVLNTSLYTAAFLLVQIPLSLGLALLLNDRRIVGRSFFRFAFFSCYLVGPVFAGVVFSLFLGSVNRLLASALPAAGPIGFLTDPKWAMVSTLLASLWLTVGFGMIYFLAALQSVDPNLYEAARMDGAGCWARFTNVTLPGIRPVLIFLILVGTISGLQLFELPFVLFQQSAGPNNAALTIVMYLYMAGFEAGSLGYAAAIGWMLLLIILAVVLLQLAIHRGHRET